MRSLVFGWADAMPRSTARPAAVQLDGGMIARREFLRKSAILTGS
ncbi:MAG: hypothetical protein ACRELZ_18335 [Candidatus Rokuibacteriota bacterium]